MNGFACIILLVFNYVSCDELLRLVGASVNHEVLVVDGPDGGPIPPTVYKTINKYACSVEDNFPGSHLVVYGQKEWTFPRQTVNLTLTYPTEQEINTRLESETSEEDALLITGFKVIIYIDGATSQGYISDGGILQDSIRLTFVSREVTHLRYQFWLHGVSSNRPEMIGFSSTMNPINLCR